MTYQPERFYCSPQLWEDLTGQRPLMGYEPDIKWFSWEDIGMGVGNPAAVRKLELYDPGAGVLPGGLMQIDLAQTYDKDRLLELLRENRDKHAAIVEEARAGYLKMAEAKLREKLDALLKGSLTSVSVHLHPPKDHTKDYDVIIRQLELSKETEIELDTSEFRTLVMDEWGWARDFYAVNAGYSETAMARSRALGFAE